MVQRIAARHPGMPWLPLWRLGKHHGDISGSKTNSQAFVMLSKFQNLALSSHASNHPFIWFLDSISLFPYPSFLHHPHPHNVQIGPPILNPFAGNSLAEHMGNYRGDFTCHLGSNIESNFKRTVARGYIYLACLC